MNVPLFVMEWACNETAKFRDPNCKDPIDEDDIAYMYMIGLAQGMRIGKKEEPTTESAKEFAISLAHHWMRKGYEMRNRELDGTKQLKGDHFRQTME